MYGVGQARGGAGAPGVGSDCPGVGSEGGGATSWYEPGGLYELHAVIVGPTPYFLMLESQPLPLDFHPVGGQGLIAVIQAPLPVLRVQQVDRQSTRLNSSH